MKKSIRKLLFALLICAVLGTCAILAALGQKTASVRVFTVQPETQQRIVSGYGKIKELQRNGYYFDIPIKISDVSVQTGDRVRAGDLVLSIDLGATETALKLSAAKIYSLSSTETVEAGSLLNGAAATYSEMMQEFRTVPAFLYAPYDGVVSALNAEAGSYTDPYEPLVVFSDDSGYYAEISLTQESALEVAVGQSVALTLLETRATVAAVITEIVPRAQLQSADASVLSAFSVKARLTADAEFSPAANQSVLADICVAEEPNQLTVPYEALYVDKNGDNYLFVVRGGRAVRIDVVLGSCYRTRVAVVSGLSRGESVIVASSQTLQNNNRVRVSQ